MMKKRRRKLCGDVGSRDGVGLPHRYDLDLLTRSKGYENPFRNDGEDALSTTKAKIA
jgi:hypothetical protein